MARQPLLEALMALRLDSGPPLYYAIARFDSIAALRWLSLVFAAIAFGTILFRRSLGVTRFIAATLLAVFPPAVLFAADARAYALCAMFVTFGVLLLDAGKPFHAAAAFVLAAYSHYYGVLFFPALLLPTRDSRLATRLAAAVGAGLAYLPGFWLSAQQPEEAMSWLTAPPWFAPLKNVSFAGEYPAALLAPAPAEVIIVALIALVVAGARSARFLPMVLIPVAFTMIAPLAGRPIYFPMRFEAVIAPPLALWLASSLAVWKRPVRVVVLSLLVLVGAGRLVSGTMEHLRRPLDPYRQAAMVVSKLAAPGETIVATGYLYLETAVVNRNVVAFPRDQAAHPGWRSRTAPDPRELPSGPFLWMGERGSPELAAVARARRTRAVWQNERVVIVRAAQFQP